MGYLYAIYARDYMWCVCVCVLVVQAAKELSSYDAYEPQQCQSLVMKVQCGAAILVVTNISPVDIKTYSTRGESCLVLKS